jgi:hypothetical protein
MGKFIRPNTEPTVVSESVVDREILCREITEWVNECSEALKDVPLNFEMVDEAGNNVFLIEGMAIIAEAAKDGDASKLVDALNSWTEKYKKVAERAEETGEDAVLWTAVAIAMHLLSGAIAFVAGLASVATGAPIVGAIISMIAVVVFISSAIRGIANGAAWIPARAKMQVYGAKLKKLRQKAEKTNNKELIAALKKAEEAYSGA